MSDYPRRCVFYQIGGSKDLLVVDYVPDGKTCHEPYRLRKIVGGVTVSDAGYRTERRAREMFERRVEALVNLTA